MGESPSGGQVPSGPGEGALGPPGPEQRLQDLGRLLARAHGCLVRGPGGEPLGRIAGLSYGPDDRWPSGLILRRHGLRGLWSARTWEVPFSAVAAVALEPREVRLDGAGALPGGAPGQPALAAPAPAVAPAGSSPGAGR